MTRKWEELERLSQSEVNLDTNDMNGGEHKWLQIEKDLLCWYLHDWKDTGLPKPGLRSGLVVISQETLKFLILDPPPSTTANLFPKLPQYYLQSSPFLPLATAMVTGRTFITISHMTEIPNWSLLWFMVLSNASSTLAAQFYFQNWNHAKPPPPEVFLISVKETPSLKLFSPKVWSLQYNLIFFHTLRPIPQQIPLTLQNISRIWPMSISAPLTKPPSPLVWVILIAFQLPLRFSLCLPIKTSCHIIDQNSSPMSYITTRGSTKHHTCLQAPKINWSACPLWLNLLLLSPSPTLLQPHWPSWSFLKTSTFSHFMVFLDTFCVSISISGFHSGILHS